MKHLAIFLFTGLVTLNISAAHGAKPRTYEEWEKCRESVFSSHEPGYYGAAGRMAKRDIRLKCGDEPMQKKGSIYVLSKKNCDGIYEQSLSECSRMDKSYCHEGVNGLSMASHGWIEAKNSNLDGFNRLCKQVCTSRKMPDRETFGKMICGGS